MPSEKTFDWNDSIENDDEKNYVILTPGDYNFTVTKFERTWHTKKTVGGKVPDCNEADLTLSVDTDEGTANVFIKLYLCESMEWKLSAFFRSIGKKKHGERVEMDWDHVVGARGRARFKVRDYTGRDGNPKQSNDVDKFIDWDEKYFPARKQEMIDLDDDGDDLPF